MPFGFIMAGQPRNPAARVQIASVQTLVRRKVPRAALVIADEAHLSTANTWTKILEQYPKARILGCTATPWRLAGKPLVGSYDRCVVVAQPRELREQGHLCDYNGFSYLTPDLSNVGTVGGEYNEKQSAAAMRQPSIVANIVEQWLAHARELSTVVFAVTVEHSLALTEEFKAAGVRAEHLDGKTSPLERAAILKRVDTGVTRVLCNVGVAVEGLDIPRLKCCVLARPTKSLARAIQMMGRVRRPWQGQKARIHDHAFLIKLHGLPDAERDYTLSAKPVDPPSLTQCESCRAMYAGNACPACSHTNEVEPTVRKIVTVDDAEQFDFDSASEAPAAPAVDLPPVEIRWDKIGREIEGEYLGCAEKETPFGSQRVYTVRSAKRTYLLPGTAHLNALMDRVQYAGGRPRIRVTYTGDLQLGGGRAKRLFSVGVDDGA